MDAGVVIEEPIEAAETDAALVLCAGAEISLEVDFFGIAAL